MVLSLLTNVGYTWSFQLMKYLEFIKAEIDPIKNGLCLELLTIQDFMIQNVKCTS